MALLKNCKDAQSKAGEPTDLVQRQASHDGNITVRNLALIVQAVWQVTESLSSCSVSRGRTHSGDPHSDANG
jgi:hypothetical protein